MSKKGIIHCLWYIEEEAQGWVASRAHQEDAELRALAAVGVHHVEGLAIGGRDDALEARAHVHELALEALVLHGQHARAHRHGLHQG